MKEPGVPPTESHRLQALAEYCVLDTPADPALDALTKLAARVLGVPIALISIIDDHRQWFKSRHGLDATETPRNISFCGHVVANDEPLIVSDASLDERFANNPLVQGAPNIRFYAGMPLRTAAGHVLGTLCAIGTEPRELGDAECETLRQLASHVMSLLELRRSEALFAERELRLRTLFEALAEGVVMQGASGNILASNGAAEQILGLTEDQLRGRTSIDAAWRAVHEDGRPFPGETHPAMVTLRTGEPATDVVMGIHRPDGTLTWIHVNARALIARNASRPHSVVSTFRDITAQRRAAENSARNERLITTGILAAGVGHEINNPLTYVISNVEHALEEIRSMAGGSPSGRLVELAEVLSDALEGSERIRKIVRGLRTLAREEGEAVATDVVSVADVALSMAMHEIRSKAALTTEFAPTPLVLADENRLTQVLVNLVVNAAQSFTTNDPETNKITVQIGTEDGRVFIHVVDNGPGIGPEVLSRIFDPFFTTKPIGKGTGLGLSISHAIVSNLGGELTCESERGSGTTFRISLPAAVPIAPVDSPSRPPAPRGHVLVVDDERAVLRALSRTLSAEHDVVAVSDARDALARIHGGERFDVIFCDLMMPFMDGLEFFERTLAIAPAMSQRFVFMSGGVTNERVSQFLAGIDNERLDKPFASQALRTLATKHLGARHRDR